MRTMRCTAISYSLAQQPATLSEWEQRLLRMIRQELTAGSRLMLFPELFLMGLSQYFPDTVAGQLRRIAEYTEQTLQPMIQSEIGQQDICLCLGSGPRLARGQIWNTAPIYLNGKWVMQDKIHLTPWETDFAAGDAVTLLNFHGLKLVVLICFDIEQPSLAYKLKQEGVDIILVPSATSNRQGNDRVNRCASARSVELGAVVITAPLVGDSSCDLVDHGEGRQGWFWPSQDAVTFEGEQYSAYSVKDTLVHSVTLDLDVLRRIKQRDQETKPFHMMEKDVRILR
jgi:predicted amidohydrolase